MLVMLVAFCCKLPVHCGAVPVLQLPLLHLRDLLPVAMVRRMSSDLQSESDVMAGRRFRSRLQHLSASRRSRSACTSGQLPADASSRPGTASLVMASCTCSAMLRSSSPVSTCRITTPNAYTSDSMVSSPVMKKTGSIYPIVPIGFVRRQIVSSPNGFICTMRAVPKSPSRLTFWASRRIFVSFRSAWMMAWGRLEWRCARAERCSARILIRSFHGSPLESPSMSVPLGRCS